MASAVSKVLTAVAMPIGVAIGNKVLKKAWAMGVGHEPPMGQKEAKKAQKKAGDDETFETASIVESAVWAAVSAGALVLLKGVIERAMDHVAHKQLGFEDPEEGNPKP